MSYIRTQQLAKTALALLLALPLLIGVFSNTRPDLSAWKNSAAFTQGGANEPAISKTNKQPQSLFPQLALAQPRA